ncbi:MAG: metallophosphatase family protein [Clostridia bacterium]|nr:metallophosphatase family protein [Clostridia bacterium]
MRIALMADIHGNLPALESVMKGMKKHAPDKIISLGDQVNLGPSPREVLALLKAEGVDCLHGNHERYLLSAMQGDPAYAGANFNALRFGAQILKADEITFPKEIRMGSTIFCHALPQDDRFPVYDARKALPLLREMHFPQNTHILCGHGHNPTHIAMGSLSIDSIGSVGCMDDGVPGTAPFAILDIERDASFLRPYYVHYDASAIKPLFIKSGMADYCPIMAHIISLQMAHNIDIICGFVDRAWILARDKGETTITEATWKETDAAYPWPDGVSTAEYWR